MAACGHQERERFDHVQEVTASHDDPQQQAGAGPGEFSIEHLAPLTHSRSWILRRVDRLEFIDLSTVKRTIVFTLDLERLPRLMPAGASVFPLALLRRDGIRAGAQVTDRSGGVIAHLSRRDSDDKVRQALRAALMQLELTDEELRETVGATGHDLLDHVQRHTDGWCELLTRDGSFDGCASIAAEKWGCPAAARIARKLAARYPDRHPDALPEVLRLLFDWQNNFVLLVPGHRENLDPDLETITFSYDEELQTWLTPWDRRVQALGPTGREGYDPNRPLGLTISAAKEERAHLGRPPFGREVDALRSPSALRAAANAEAGWLRRFGRLGPLSLAWHVAWTQMSSWEVGFHLVEVVLPPELAIVRLRMVQATLELHPPGHGDLESRKHKVEYVRAAPLTANSTATLAAPKPPEGSTPLSPLPDVLMSLVVSQRNPGAWFGAFLFAALGGVAALTFALTDLLTKLAAQSGSAVTILVLAPTVLAAVLSVRAASDIAGELTQILRLLLALIGTLTLVAAVRLILGPVPGTGAQVSSDLKAWWIGIGVALVIVAMCLLSGWLRLRALLGFRDLLPKGPHVEVQPPERALVPEGAPWIPPPDRFIETGEGDRVPWGWLWSNRSSLLAEDEADRLPEDVRYWDSAYEGAAAEQRTDLVRWRENCFVARLPNV